MTTEERSHTPEPMRSVARGITFAQKQALIDNLQLEITERARKLRAQYALQAQGLRARMELRVNRIPQALRKRKMQDVMDECAEKEKPVPSAPLPVVAKAAREAKVKAIMGEPSKRKSLKRMSDQISTEDNNNTTTTTTANDYNDKENMPAPESSSHEPLPNPKKRSKPTTTANTKATRTASRTKPAPSNVLSPKSHNSRTLPRSPFKSANVPSPEKLQPPPTSRYALPTKTSTATLAPPSKPTSRAPSRQTTKRGAAAANTHTETKTETEGRSSEASTTSSAGTTIITKPTTKKAPAAGVRKPAVPKAAAAAGGKSMAAVKKENIAPAPVASGRTLRKRG